MLQAPPPSIASEAPPPIEFTPEREPRQFRPDIEGLRAVAVVLVVLYHANLLGITGGYVGVDVFLVISGFLITRQLVSGISKRGVHELPNFYGRRIRRLLPASCLVVCTTVIATWLWAPAAQARSSFIDAMFSTFYGLNYRLAERGTSYLHGNDAVSPLQHFWSLGVEEQFYIVTPILIVLTMLLHRFRSVALMTLLVSVFAVSLWFSITTTASSPSWAYFSLHTRAWEMAAGGLVALTAGYWARLPRLITNLSAWAGVAVIIASAWVLSEDTIYPGSAALMPVLACAVVIGAGCANRFHSIERLFAEPAIQGIGKVSYSWYLWHWPMLVLFPLMAGQDLNWVRRVEIVLLSLLFAIITYHVVENPVRKQQRLNFEWVRIGVALAAVVVAVAVIAGNTLITPVGTGIAASAVTISTDSKADRQIASALTDALTLQKAPRNLKPSVDQAPNDFPLGCITQIQDTDPDKHTGSCTIGDPKGKTTIGMFGDSHVQQWGTGLDAAGKKLDIKIVVRTKSACPAVDLEVYNSLLKREYRECDAWRPAAIQQMIALQPKYVIMSQADAIAGADTSDQVWAEATVRTINKFQDAHIPVLFFLDTPLIPFNVPQCIGENLKSVQKCGLTDQKRYAYPTRHAAVAKAAKAAGAKVVEPGHWLCVKAGCPPIVGNILVYRDEVGHITSTYSKWLTPALTHLLATYDARDTST